MGFGEVLGHLPSLLRRRREMKRLLLRRRVDLFLPVDAPGFNLPLARSARQAGVPVLYYIAPQVWAWGSHRVRAMARDLDALAVILPFEEDWFTERGVAARYVGHPLAALYPQPPKAPAEGAAVGLLPGSRQQEIRRMLPVLLRAAERLAEKRPGQEFLLLESPTLSAEDYDPWIRDFKYPLKRNRDPASQILPKLAAAWVTSGTATLESALAGLPMVVAYRTGKLSYALARRLVKVPHIALANLVAGGALVPELVQEEAEPGELARAMDALLDSAFAREEQRRGFLQLARRLGDREPGEAVARMVREILEEA
jgi:lipid-A-disaccharide synthase